MANNLHVIIVDIDGVLTDGTVQYTQSGKRSKSFHSRDITAIKRLHSMGFDVILASQSSWDGVEHFSNRCGCQVFIGVIDKLKLVNEELGLSNGNYIAVADDHGDEELLKHAALAFKPADAVVKSGIRLATPGGHGVMAELADRLTVRLIGHDRDVMFDGINTCMKYNKGGIAHHEPDPHDFCANARANDMSNAEIGMAKEIEHLREENRELRESNERLRIINRELRKENAALKEWCDRLNDCCNSLESEVQMLKAKIYDIKNNEK